MQQESVSHLEMVLWANCDENFIVKEKGQQSAAEMVYGTNPKWISNMRTIGKMSSIARHSDKKVRRKLAHRGNTVMFVGYANIHENYVYQFIT
jgi:hypothetical protein